MFKYEIKENGKVIETRKSKSAYTHVMVWTKEGEASSVFSFHKTQKAAQTSANRHNNLVATSEYHAKAYDYATFVVIEITPDMVSA
jgi:hypothetical protein